MDDVPSSHPWRRAEFRILMPCHHAGHVRQFRFTATILP
ncbi:hypothetical protein PACID_07210 [Acidipropionibacterium acidipropionici ATCC 4875]|uniref:Uncharacterized protein n=1 Tax=Acidipropionibacterium acidipropionici (strain ATCC 4875 / DSM 20272 / JCM 6432 / NBRC 12425 / NCIMB 8070 / 4) TaxID=1171373 RepID=K7RKV0_ACIA4|nr:hypothetical protein PACID_07210 [Acidipropionibacterium acidipropionici ATCC 4875]